MPFILQAMSNASQQQGPNAASPVVIAIDTPDLAPPSTSQAQNSASPSGGIRVIISSLKASAGPNYPPPPTYEEALDPNALPPPAYDSLFGQVQTAHQSSDGVTEFVKNLTILLFGTVGCLACIGLAVVVPFAMVVIGTIYYNQCPAEPNIPLYLVVGGGVTLLNNLLGNFRIERNEQNNEVSLQRRKSPAKAFITTFMFIWFVLGSFWVYKHYMPSFDPMDRNYCHPTVYLFAFWVITSSYLILLFLSLSIFCIAFMAVGAAEQIQQQASSRR
ncbi:uncharacterized protein LOC132195936 [Neocloeon triangulifer]|uniref:uncharacterized protein LOC132195936 n=1 Tax=Neocloeon triangulifer TaxID=2078957 RepID=UPI00286F3828|nr:uncharacterized protein LOC132195936 [Neocloeon triangulifer]